MTMYFFDQLECSPMLEPSAVEQRQTYWQHIYDDTKLSVQYIHRDTLFKEREIAASSRDVALWTHRTRGRRSIAGANASAAHDPPWRPRTSSTVIPTRRVHTAMTPFVTTTYARDQPHRPQKRPRMASSAETAGACGDLTRIRDP